MANDDPTMRIARKDQVPTAPDAPPASSPAPPPPPSGPRAVGRPPERRALGPAVIAVAVAFALAFVAGAYLVVDRAERDRPQSAPLGTTTTDPDATTTEATTTTTAAPVTQDPASVAVTVLNGTPQRGWAGENGNVLDALGYATARADANQDDVPTTTVYVAEASFEPDAAAIAEALGLPDAPVEPRPEDPLSTDPAAASASVVVVLGADSLP